LKKKKMKHYENDGEFVMGKEMEAVVLLQ